jgi:signal transduction histidine kinase
MRRLMSVLNRCLGWIPAPVRLPALAGVIVFVVAVGTTQLALTLESRESDRKTEQLARVYLDGLAAAIAGPVRAGDWAEVERRFRAAFGEQEGVAETALLLIASDGRTLTRVATRDGEPPPARHVTGLQPAFSLDERAGLAWASRAVAGQADLRLVATLDIAPLLSARRQVFWGVVLLDLVIAALCALLASLILRRINRPTEALLALMQEAARGSRQRVPMQIVADADRGVAPVLNAYNEMIDGLAERERLRADIAERSRAAALGQLAATMAHEVRNPLGGLSTAVATLRKFGDDAAVRTESLDFLGRGIDQIDSIVTRMLNIHRPEDERRLTRADFEDLRLLVRPAAAKKGLRLDWSLALPESFAVGASGVRQVLLNLLLNACAASPREGTVTLTAAVEGDALVCTVSDQGQGMEPSRVAQLVGGRAAEPMPRRLGLDTVVSLLGSLEGAASVEAGPDGGSRVRISIPLAGA